MGSTPRPFPSRPAYATYARLREDPAGLGRAFELVSYAHARLGGLAAVLALALAGPVLIPLIGEKWWPMIPILQSLAPYMALRGLLDNAAVLVVTQGRPREETKARMLQLAIMVLAIPPLVLWQGAQGAALGLDLATVAACVYLCRRVRGQVNIAWIPLVLPPVLALLAGGTAALGVANLTASRGLASQGAASAAAGLAAYALVLLALERGKPLRELRYLWERLR